ncbi:MAG: protein phosphatase 2C domain-containing protein [Bacteroidota bacterium]
MQIHQTVRLGHFHPVYCEDALWVGEIQDEIYLAAVMDGCTMGKESHFVASLVVKLLRKTVKHTGYLAWTDPDHPLNHRDLSAMGKEMLEALFVDLKACAHTLFLAPEELLTTLNLCLVDTKRDGVWHIVVGDGFSAVEGKVIDWDQNNKPDYLGYHLGESFNLWFERQMQMALYQGVKSFAIASDGVDAFENLDKRSRNFQQEIPFYLLLDEEFLDLPRMLEKKIELLEKDFGEIATDDLAIIRMKW